MTHKLLAAALAAICVVATWTPTLAGWQQAGGSGIIAGQVIDATTKQPIGGAVVTLSAVAAPGQPPLGSQARRGVAVANAEGRFVFRDVPTGAFHLSSTRSNYAPGATGRRRPEGPTGTFSLDAGARVTDVVIPMWRLSSISGSIRDDRGEPAIGVSVWALSRTLNGGRVALGFGRGTVEATDDRGHFRLSGLLPGDYVVTTRSSTQSNAVSSVDAYKASVTSGTGAVRGDTNTGALMVATAGLVVDEWQVSVSSGNPAVLPGKDGSLLVHPTVYHGNTTTAGDATIITLGSGDDRTSVDLTLRLVPGLRVSGLLTSPEGPAAKHGIQLVPVEDGEPVQNFAAAYSTTDSAGRFALFGVPAGSYVLKAYRTPQTSAFRPPPPPAAGAPPIASGETGTPSPSSALPPIFAAVPIVVGTEDVTDVRVSLELGGRVSGRIVFDGITPLPTAAQLERMRLSLGPVTGVVPGETPARVGTTLTFETMGYPSGRYHVNVIPPDTAWTVASMRINGVDVAGQAFSHEGTAVNDVVVTLTDKAITLTGSAISDDPTLSAGASIILVPADTRGWLATGMSPRRTATTTTTATGTYRLIVPLPGDYIAVALPPDISPELSPELLSKFQAIGVRVSFTSGESKTQALTVRRPQ